MPDTKERHVGDLGNIEANAEGTATIESYDRLLKFHGCALIIGRAVVVTKPETSEKPRRRRRPRRLRRHRLGQTRKISLQDQPSRGEPTAQVRVPIWRAPRFLFDGRVRERTFGEPEPANSSTRIVVAGSINMDLVVRSARLPRRGETIIGRETLELPGGKGANQAVAAARLDADVFMIGRVGDDGFGEPCEPG